MIPKIIHYCWLSGDPIPDKLLSYMKSWKKYLPDYEFILWDKTRFDINSVKWVQEAYDSHKYAFAADYIRQYAVYTYGGFYMDMDVEVLRSFDPLLFRRYAIGYETMSGVEAGVFGAEKESPIIKCCLDWYAGKSFINSDGTLNLAGCPRVMMDSISSKYQVKFSEKYSDSDDIVYLLPPEYLTAKSSETLIVKVTKNTYTIHHFAGSWLSESLWRDIRHYIKSKLGIILGTSFVKKMNAIYSNFQKK